MNDDQLLRYSRQIMLPQVDIAGQQKLLQSKVLIIGLGGLGSPVAMYLASAGVGHLSLCDHDQVDLSNLQRQIVHRTADLGKPKVQSAAECLKALNPEVELTLVDHQLQDAELHRHIDNVDVVVDASDNFRTRLQLNDACVRLGKPLVYGAVMRFQGQVSVFWPDCPEPPRDAHGRTAPCFRCMLPHPPSAADAPSCAAAGVLGVLPGIVGTLQASEALKLVLGIGRPLVGRLLMIDALGVEFRQARIAADPNCVTCSVRPSRS